ncbi:KAP family P-loop domain-containing protein, partial [Solimonas aquatica]
QASGTSATLTSVHFVDDQHGWAVGNGGTILATADGGLSWKRVRLLKHTLSPAPWFWLLSLAIVILALAIAGKPPERDALQQIGSSDKPRAGLADDRLQTAPRVLALSRLLRNRGTSPPLVIAIDGEWGTGKSTLMRMLETDLRCYGARCAWFNAWHHQNDEHLLAALLDTLRREITPRTPVYWLKLFALRLRRYRWRAMPSLLALALLAGFWAQLLSADRSASASRLEGLADAAACLTVGTACATVAAPESTSTTHLNLRRRVAQISRTHERSVLYLALLLSALPALWGLLGTLSPFPNPAVLKAAAGMMKMRAAEKETSYRYRFAGDFRDVTTALLPYRLYLFIDDLDRCDSKSTASLLEAVNFLCESGEVVVVLGIARETVECNLGLAYSELAAEMARDGETPQKRRDFAERFLRKLVNLRVQVPELDSRGTAAMLTEQRPARTEYEWRLVPGYLRWLDRMLLPALGLFFVLIFMACAGTLGFYLGQGERTPQTRSPDFAVQTPTSSGAAANSAAPATARPEATQKNDQPPPGTSYLEPGDPGHVPAAVWMLLGALGLVLGLRLIWTWRTRFNSSDPRDLHWSLEAWSPLLRLTQTSPREIRRFQNRLRHLVATLNAPEQIPALPESPGPFVEAWYRRVLNEQEAAQLRGEVDGMPGSLITAMLAMFAAAQTHAVWPAVLAASLQWLTGEPKLAEIADEPLSEQKRREFHYAAVRLDLERLQWNEPIPTKPEDRSQVLQRYADALFDAVQEHQQKAGESNLERFSLNRLTGAGPGFGGNPWEKLLKQYELLYGKPRLRKA